MIFWNATRKEKDKKDIEQLNRLIEYSILQQLIYIVKYAQLSLTHGSKEFFISITGNCLGGQ